VCVCSLSHPACNAHAPYFVACGVSGCTLFLDGFSNGMILGKTLLNTKRYWTQNVIEHKTLLDTYRYWTQNVIGHKTLLDTKRYWTQNVIEQKTLLNTKRYWTQNVCLIFISTLYGTDRPCGLVVRVSDY
jgi:hypothetical protein